MTKQRRTKIENLSHPARDLTGAEKKKIRGGTGLPETGGGHATRLSIKTTYVHEGGHTAEDSAFDEDQN